ncbi:MAG: alpha/beta hydrolase [Rubrivivax sp.]|jgi:alpha-beta hydrolase superfamily lysophospholipase|nr:alpha/beta hydrolase [Rubrivivax sp.]
MSTSPSTPDTATRPRRLPSLTGWLAGLALLLAVLGSAGCAALDEQQRRWIFQPSDRTWSGGLAAAQAMDEVWIDFRSALTGEPVKLHGLWAAHPNPDAPVLLYLHGARWDVRGSANRMRRMQELGFSVLGIDYRGFGKSTGTLPDEDLAYEDARAAWSWLASRHPARTRYIFGHSLGGAIAVHLASEVSDAQGLMVEGSFTSIADVVKTYRWGWLPISPLITQRFEAGERIAKVKAPVLVVHGSEDRTISATLGRALYERAPQPKRFVLVDGGSHHNTNGLAQEHYRQALRDLFNGQPPPPASRAQGATPAQHASTGHSP